MIEEAVAPNHRAVVTILSVSSGSFFPKLLDTKVAVTLGKKEITPKENWYNVFAADCAW